MPWPRRWGSRGVDTTPQEHSVALLGGQRHLPLQDVDWANRPANTPYRLTKRRGRDSNPGDGGCPPNGFQDRRIVGCSDEERLFVPIAFALQSLCRGTLRARRRRVGMTVSSLTAGTPPATGWASSPRGASLSVGRASPPRPRQAVAPSGRSLAGARAAVTSYERVSSSRPQRARSPRCLRLRLAADLSASQRSRIFGSIAKHC